MYHCEKCGGTNVQVEAWVDANTSVVLGDGSNDEAYCTDCAEHVALIWRCAETRAAEIAVGVRDDDQATCEVCGASGDADSIVRRECHKGGETISKFGTITLPGGRVVQLVQQAYNDNYRGDAAWFSSGYLSTEVPDADGPTVKVRWDSLGADEDEDDADWASPASVMHYSLGELLVDPAIVRRECHKGAA